MLNTKLQVMSCFPHLCARPRVHTRTNKRDELVTSLVDNKPNVRMRSGAPEKFGHMLPADLTLVSLLSKTPKIEISLKKSIWNLRHFRASNIKETENELTNSMCRRSPNEIFAVTTECRMLEETGNKFMILDFINVFLLERSFSHF